MYPREELDLLRRRKAILRTRIRLQRVDVGVHMHDVLRPFAWIGLLQEKWRSLPVGFRTVSGPLAFILQRVLIRRLPWRGKLLLWIPAIWKVAKVAAPLLKSASHHSARTPSQATIERVVKGPPDCLRPAALIGSGTSAPPSWPGWRHAALPGGVDGRR